jgi:hypothetical protein
MSTCYVCKKPIASRADQTTLYMPASGAHPVHVRCYEQATWDPKGMLPELADELADQVEVADRRTLTSAANGRRGGRPRAFSPETIAMAQQLLVEAANSSPELTGDVRNQLATLAHALPRLTSYGRNRTR